jgi:hypothetical protein
MVLKSPVTVDESSTIQRPADVPEEWPVKCSKRSFTTIIAGNQPVIEF